MQQRRKIRYTHSVCSIDGRHSRAAALQYRDRNGEDPIDRNTDYREEPQEGMNARILWEIRLPRTLAAGILGGALALAGYLLQTFFHNPIAGPFCT